MLWQKRRLVSRFDAESWWWWKEEKEEEKKAWQSDGEYCSPLYGDCPSPSRLSTPTAPLAPSLPLLSALPQPVCDGAAAASTAGATQQRAWTGAEAFPEAISEATLIEVGHRIVVDLILQSDWVYQSLRPWGHE